MNHSINMDTSPTSRGETEGSKYLMGLNFRPESNYSEVEESSAAKSKRIGNFLRL